MRSICSTPTTKRMACSLAILWSSRSSGVWPRAWVSALPRRLRAYSCLLVTVQHLHCRSQHRCEHADNQLLLDVGQSDDVQRPWGLLLLRRRARPARYGSSVKNRRRGPDNPRQGHVLGARFLWFLLGMRLSDSRERSKCTRVTVSSSLVSLCRY